MNPRIYFTHHLHALIQSLQNLYRTPIATLLTVAVLSLALLLPTVLMVLLNNVRPIVKDFDTGNHVVVYLKQAVTITQAQSLVDKLKERSDLSTVTFISAEQGQQEFSKASGLTEAFAALPANPLPSVIEFIPTDTNPNHLEALQKDISQWPEVDTVKFDMEWVKRLFAIMDLVEQFIYGLGLILALAVLLIIGNTIRGIVQAHRSEILVLKLMGASNYFIRRPFLYAGFIYGLMAGFVTLLLSSAFIAWLSIPVKTLAALYDSNIILHGMSFSGIIMVLVISIVLGILGAWVALTEHLLDVEVRA